MLKPPGKATQHPPCWYTMAPLPVAERWVALVSLLVTCLSFSFFLPAFPLIYAITPGIPQTPPLFPLLCDGRKKGSRRRRPVPLKCSANRSASMVADMMMTFRSGRCGRTDRDLASGR